MTDQPKPRHPGGRPRSPDATARRLRTTIRVSPADLALVAAIAEHEEIDEAEVWRDAVERWGLQLKLV